MRKVLNLYAGIGGNRKLWEDVDVTAVEINPEIAAIYQDFFPDDTVIVGDAHQYLLEHYDDGWDFIWSSPPCPTHSRIRNVAGVGSGQEKPVYPEMGLYQEIIFLQQIYHSSGCSFKGRYCVENVVSYYGPLIIPQSRGRHYFWANFVISDTDTGRVPEMTRWSANQLMKFYEFDLTSYDLKPMDKRRLLRNCVHPDMGKHIFDCAFKLKQSSLEV